jgi:hypothetical protein
MYVTTEHLRPDARLDVPPPPSARVRLQADFGTRFVLFGDAEEEFDWSGPFRRDATSVTTMRALPEANARFNAAGLRPCWLADWPVIDDPGAGAILRALVTDGLASVGTQLHPWVNPPFAEEVSKRNSYTGNLPVALQRDKLQRLTDRIADVVGVRPRIYRAGRYGIGPNTAALLAEAGYALDVSVRSHFDYRGQGGPNFARHPLWPWKVADGLYELPLTTAHTGPLGRWPAIHTAESLRGTLARTGLFARIPLTPEGVPLADALDAIDVLLDQGHQLFSLSFHTPSLVPGHTPYVRSEADLDSFWRWWDGVFDRFAARGVLPIDAETIVDEFDRATRLGR